MKLFFRNEDMKRAKFLTILIAILSLTAVIFVETAIACESTSSEEFELCNLALAVFEDPSTPTREKQKIVNYFYLGSSLPANSPLTPTSKTPPEGIYIEKSSPSSGRTYGSQSNSSQNTDSSCGSNCSSSKSTSSAEETMILNEHNKLGSDCSISESSNYSTYSYYDDCNCRKCFDLRDLTLNWMNNIERTKDKKCLPMVIFNRKHRQRSR